jgi:hypothetical protein
MEVCRSLGIRVAGTLARVAPCDPRREKQAELGSSNEEQRNRGTEDRGGLRCAWLASIPSMHAG